MVIKMEVVNNSELWFQTKSSWVSESVHVLLFPVIVLRRLTPARFADVQHQLCPVSICLFSVLWSIVLTYQKMHIFCLYAHSYEIIYIVCYISMHVWRSGCGIIIIWIMRSTRSVNFEDILLVHRPSCIVCISRLFLLCLLVFTSGCCLISGQLSVLL